MRSRPKKICFFYILFLLGINCLQLANQEIQIDHVIAVVSDLEDNILEYQKLGFTVKMGKLHRNGLLNAHIKFNNRTSFELMSIRGEAGDEMARSYRDLLRQGEGGVFIALSMKDTRTMEKRLTDMNLTHQTIQGPGRDYITFPKNSGLEHFFFIKSCIVVHDSPDLLIHANKSRKIKEVWIDGNDRTKCFLEGLGIKSIGKTFNRTFGSVEQFTTHGGDIIVVPRKDLTKRPRIKLISFEKEDQTESIKIEF